MGDEPMTNVASEIAGGQSQLAAQSHESSCDLEKLAALIEGKFESLDRRVDDLYNMLQNMVADRALASASPVAAQSRELSRDLGDQTVPNIEEKEREQLVAKLEDQERRAKERVVAAESDKSHEDMRFIYELLPFAIFRVATLIARTERFARDQQGNPVSFESFVDMCMQRIRHYNDPTTTDTSTT